MFFFLTGKETVYTLQGCTDVTCLDYACSEGFLSNSAFQLDNNNNNNNNNEEEEEEYTKECQRISEFFLINL